MPTLIDAMQRLPPEIQRRIALFVQLESPVYGGKYSPDIMLFKRRLLDRRFHRQMRLRAGLPATKRGLQQSTLQPVGYDSLRQEMSSHGMRTGLTFLDVQGRMCLYLSVYGGNTIRFVKWMQAYGLLKCCERYRVPANYLNTYEPALHRWIRDYVFVARL